MPESTCMFVHALYLVILTGTAALFSWLFTALLVKGLPEGMLLDQPNERSNHRVPVRRGGGIAVVGVLIAFLLVSSAPGLLAFLLLLLAGVSLMDDYRPLPAQWRLLVQGFAVAMGLSLLDGPVFQGLLPLPLDHLLAALLWLWMVNLYNFMDGIDGITSAETVSIGLGIVLLALSVPGDMRALMVDSGIFAASILGFAWWNKHPARIFLGDVGSVPLGFMAGFLLLKLAASGLWAAALILPAYYLLDASLTLLQRALRGEKIWEAHSQHAYQHAVRGGRGHDAVVAEMVALNIGLVVLAVLSAHYPALRLAAIGVAYLGAFGLAARFRLARSA